MDPHYRGEKVDFLFDLPGGVRLRHSLGRSDAGISVDLRSPYLEDLSYDEVVALASGWDGDIPSELEEIDDKEKGNFGARSIMKPFKDRENDVLEYWGT